MSFYNLYNEFEGYRACSEYTDMHIQKAIQMHEGDGLPGFPSVDVFIYLITPQLDKLRDPALELLQDVYAQLSKWAGHVADVHEHMTQNPKKPGLFEKIGFAKSATAEAFDHLIAQQKLKEMEKEIKHMFIWGELQHLGMDGYKELIRKRRQIKTDREKQIYDQLRKRKMFFNIITVIQIFITE